MRPARSIRIALFIILAVAVLAAGCAYTTVAVREKLPQPGPVVKAGLTADMPPVADSRQWPTQVSTQPIPNVRIFADEITAKVRTGLVDSGLFTRLDPVAHAAPPDHSVANFARPRLSISIKTFLVANLGYNAWVAPHLLLDGALLPVFTGVLISTQGRVDSGAYILPSTRLGTSIGAKVQYFEPGMAAPVLEKDYLVRVEMEAVSERRLLHSLEKGETYGIEIGKDEGYRTLNLFVETVARDARWAYLPEFRRLVKAETVVKAAPAGEKQIRALDGVLDLLKPLAYTEEEVKVLRDGYLDAGPRATIANDMRARFLNLANAKELPPSQVISEEQAVKLFDDPALPKAEVESVLADRVMALAVKVMTNLVVEPAVPTLTSQPGARPGVAPGAQTFPSQPAMAGRPSPPVQARPAPGYSPGKAEAKKASASAQAMSAALSGEIAARVKQDPRLQSLLINQAEKAVGDSWAPMKGLLEQVGSPSTKRYLEQRTS